MVPPVHHDDDGRPAESIYAAAQEQEHMFLREEQIFLFVVVGNSRDQPVRFADNFPDKMCQEAQSGSD